MCIFLPEIVAPLALLSWGYFEPTAASWQTKRYLLRPSFRRGFITVVDHDEGPFMGIGNLMELSKMISSYDTDCPPRITLRQDLLPAERKVIQITGDRSAGIRHEQQQMRRPGTTDRMQMIESLTQAPKSRYSRRAGPSAIC